MSRVKKAQALREAQKRWPNARVRTTRWDGATIYFIGGLVKHRFYERGRGDSWEAAFRDADSIISGSAKTASEIMDEELILQGMAEAGLMLYKHDMREAARLVLAEVVQRKKALEEK